MQMMILNVLQLSQRDMFLFRLCWPIDFGSPRNPCTVYLVTNFPGYWFDIVFGQHQYWQDFYSLNLTASMMEVWFHFFNC